MYAYIYIYIYIYIYGIVVQASSGVLEVERERRRDVRQLHGPDENNLSDFTRGDVTHHYRPLL